MVQTADPHSVALFSEILAIDQLIRNRVTKVLPKGMELSHFTVLNHLAHVAEERSPAQLAKTLHLTRGAMTNTLGKLEWAGYVHIRPDWDDARRKMVAISPSGKSARNAALDAITPIISQAVAGTDAETLRSIVPVLRAMRLGLSEEPSNG